MSRGERVGQFRWTGAIVKEQTEDRIRLTRAGAEPITVTVRADQGFALQHQDNQWFVVPIAAQRLGRAVVGEQLLWALSGPGSEMLSTWLIRAEAFAIRIRRDHFLFQTESNECTLDWFNGRPKSDALGNRFKFVFLVAVDSRRRLADFIGIRCCPAW